jgi:hypothetical protein
MDEKFRQMVESLHPAFKRLTAGAPHTKGADLPKKGVYFFKEKDKPIYVGRSNNIPRRLGNHTQPKSTTSVARLIARKDLGLQSDYRKGAKDRILSHPKYGPAVEDAKKRIMAMEFRAVEETDQTKQALLEVYCAVVLQTPYNDFGNH